MIIRLLLWIGFVRYKHVGGAIRWPFYVAPRHCWAWKSVRVNWLLGERVYVFRNLPHVVKWTPGRLLPRRWGFGILGLIEFGDRG